MSIKEQIQSLKATLPEGVTLVAVSKTYPPEIIREAYEAGQRIFGENRVQELVAKYEALPKDIQWHLIGHLQTNKVKYIAPFVTLIHSVDSAHLLETIHEQALKHGRVIDVLMEVHIAREASKHGWAESELWEYMASGAWKQLTGIRLRGVMGVATFTDDQQEVRAEFERLHAIFLRLKQEHQFGPEFDTLSMGMSGDYPLAIECGSTMVRIGTLIFGARQYNKPIL